MVKYAGAELVLTFLIMLVIHLHKKYFLTSLFSFLVIYFVIYVEEAIYWKDYSSCILLKNTTEVPNLWFDSETFGLVHYFV